MNPMTAMPGGGSSLTPLNASDYDLKNMTQAMDFLSQMLDDSILQNNGKQYGLNFWYGAATVIGLAALDNLFSLISSQLRLMVRSLRRVAYPQITPIRAKSWIQIPPFGTIILILGYLGFILALEFINNNVSGAQYYTALGIRAGWLAIAQTPLLILLAGKNNLIGIVTGITYERLNILHRWVARGFLLLATIHFAVQNIGWDEYGLRTMEWNTDTCPPTGIAAYVLLLWINLSTLAPLRNLWYEFFVLQHLLTFFGFITAIMYHLPSTALYTRIYIWIPIGLYLLDRLLRTSRLLFHNAPPARATLQSTDPTATRILITNPGIKSWAPGSHVLLSIPRLGPLQSHPATIASTPTSHDGSLLFLLRSRGGFTKNLAEHASSFLSVSTGVSPATETEKPTPETTHLTLLSGPHGNPPSFTRFSSVLLVAGSTGITFVLPILLDLAARTTPLQSLTMLWAVKSIEHVNWVAGELQAGVTRLQCRGVEVSLRVFVTGTEDVGSSRIAGRGIEVPVGCTCECSTGQACECTVGLPRYEDIALGAQGEPQGSPRNSAGSLRHSSAGSQRGTAEGNGILDREHPSSSSGSSSSPNRSPSPLLNGSLDNVTISTGRPAIREILRELVDTAQGEVGVAVCGPLGMGVATRRAVAGLQGKGAEVGGLFLHVEGFAW